MRHIVLSLIIIMGISIQGQQKTYVPDDDFEALLESYNMGDGIANNDSVTTANINAVDSLNIFNNIITDLTGIEDFISLKYLDCHDNSLSNLDFSNNPNLTELICFENLIDTIIIGNCMNLEHLDLQDNLVETIVVNNCLKLQTLNLSDNLIEYVDVSQNSALKIFLCYDNYLSSLDLSTNISLSEVDLENNDLVCLNLKNGKNTNLIELWTQGNSNLSCIEVDDSTYSNLNWINNSNFYFDPNHFFSDNCNYSSFCFNNPTATITNNKTNLTVYPNPTSNIVNITLDNYTGKINLMIYDFTGKLIRSTNNRSLNIEDYPRGIYLIKVSYGDVIKNIKLVKE